MKRITQTNEVQSGDNSGIVFSGSEKASYSEDFPVSSFDDKDLVTKKVVSEMVGNIVPSGNSLMPWAPGVITDTDNYVTFQIGLIEYLFRSNIDGNSSEPSLSQGGDAWTNLGFDGLPPFFNIGTTYADGDYVRAVISAIQYVYKSKANGNIGNQPVAATSDPDWEYLGVSKGFFPDDSPYDIDDIVLDPDSNILFQSNIGNNDYALDGQISSDWQLVGINIDDDQQALSSVWSSKKTKSYADSLVVGLLNDRGSYNASSNLFPSTGGSGDSGAIMKGNLWSISGNGTLGGVEVELGDWIRSLVDNPGQSSANWAIVEGNFGFTPENVENKSDNLTSPNNTKYPTTLAVSTALSNKPNNDGTGATGTWGINISGIASKLAITSYVGAGTFPLILNGLSNNAIFRSDITVNTNTGELRAPSMLVGSLSLGTLKTIDADGDNVVIRSNSASGRIFFQNYNNSVTWGFLDVNGFNGDVVGTATNASKLSNARNINGVAFDGSANITIYDDTKQPLISTVGYPYYNGTSLIFVAGGVNDMLLGNGTFTSINPRIRLVTLGTVTPDNTPIATGDAISVFANRAQGQINAILSGVLSGSATLDFPSTAAKSVSDLTITVTGAVLSDVVSLGIPNSSVLPLGNFSAWVSAANTVTVRFTNNNDSIAQDPASGLFKVKIFK